MKKLEIDENCTLKELRERFKEKDDNYYVEIDGITLHNFSDVFSSNSEFLNLTLKEYVKYEKLQKRFERLKKQKI